ncbi:MAG TPA: Scr1 family TA system antitoxin-like transcriptional regulator [Streptosporangiaceae bacterium]|nr:Scr1 family TA system antitoxin-like transcriptional regulator [Streptosporangiaceae bacterium]
MLLQQRFLAGEPPDYSWFTDWYETVVQLVAEGRRMERVRVVSEPHSVEYDGAPDDLDEAVGVRMQRQQILYRTGKQFHFVITEAVLRYRLCPPEVMLGQLDRLVTLSTMPTIRFGVIPFEAKLPLAPVHGFWLMDERVVIVENFTASQNLNAGQRDQRLRADLRAVRQRGPIRLRCPVDHHACPG